MVCLFFQGVYLIFIFLHTLFNPFKAVVRWLGEVVGVRFRITGSGRRPPLVCVQL